MLTPTSQVLLVCDLGRADYRPTWDLQRELQAKLIEAKRSDPPVPIPHVMLLVEHPPVYTLGKSGDATNLLASDEVLDRRGATYVEIDRGGDITFHGPGQIVGYPILDLDRIYTDLGRYLRDLESVVIDTCAEYGVAGRRVDGRTGVWVGPDASGAERKICAMGIRCSRWVTMHGFAFNVETDLSYFDDIVPCGISDRGVTSLEKEAAHDSGPDVDMEVVRTELVRHFARRFGMTVRHFSSREAHDQIESYLSGEPASAA